MTRRRRRPQPARIGSITQCRCGARDGTPHVKVTVRRGVETWSICEGPTQAEYTARSIAEAARAAGISFDKEPA